MNKYKIEVKIWDWWVSWFDEDYKFCAIIEINNEMCYIERELEES